MKARTKRRIRKMLKGPQRIYALIIIIFLSLVIVASSGNNSTVQDGQIENFTGSMAISGETLFKRVCMKCHTTPEKYKSFTLYFGKAENVWEVGIRKMISAGNVRLSSEQVKLIAKYLEETYRGG